MALTLRSLATGQSECPGYRISVFVPLPQKTLYKDNVPFFMDLI